MRIPGWIRRQKLATQLTSWTALVIAFAVLAAVFGLWAILVQLGPGTFQFWIWTAQSWQAVAAGAAGFALAVFAFLTWRVQKNQYEAMYESPLFSYQPNPKPYLDTSPDASDVPTNVTECGLHWDVEFVHYGATRIAFEGGPAYTVEEEIQGSNLWSMSLLPPRAKGYIRDRSSSGDPQQWRLLKEHFLLTPGTSVVLKVFITPASVEAWGREIKLCSARLRLNAYYRTLGGRKRICETSEEFGTGQLLGEDSSILCPTVHSTEDTHS